MIITRKASRWTIPTSAAAHESVGDLLRLVRLGQHAIRHFDHYRSAAAMYAAGEISRDAFVSRWWQEQNCVVHMA
jgi:hypothetical protein